MYRFIAPAMPLDLSSALRYSSSGLRQKRSTLPVIPLGEFSLRLENHQTKPSRHDVDTSPELSLPSAHQGTKVHSTRTSPARYGPPSGFGYPLDGLRPSYPCRLCFTPAALLGFSLRSFPLSEGNRAFPIGWTHIPFRQPVMLLPKAETSPAGRGSWAFILPRVPGSRTRV
jgi:hypothetical protein